MKTYQPKKREIKRSWHLIDLDNQVLGRKATEAARLLMGKNKPSYSANIESGDYVIAINTDLLKVTGNKLKKKIYYRHTGYPGGIRALRLEEVMEKDSRLVFEAAVKNMLPKNKLQQIRMKRLKIFSGQEHPYQTRLKKRKTKKE